MPFSGKHNSADELDNSGSFSFWLVENATMLKMLKTDDARLVDFKNRSLIDPAKAVFNSWPDDKRQSWATVTSHMLKEFGPRFTDTGLARYLVNLKQKNTESCVEYAQRVKRACDLSGARDNGKKYSDMERAVLYFNTCRQDFNDHLAIQYQPRTYQGTQTIDCTLEQIVERAETWDSRHPVQQKAQQPDAATGAGAATDANTKTGANTSATATKQWRFGRPCRHCKTGDHRDATCPTLNNPAFTDSKATTDNATPEQKPTTDYTQYQSKMDYSWKKDKHRLCNTCRTGEHHWWQCPELPEETIKKIWPGGKPNATAAKNSSKTARAAQQTPLPMEAPDADTVTYRDPLGAPSFAYRLTSTAPTSPPPPSSAAVKNTSATARAAHTPGPMEAPGASAATRDPLGASGIYYSLSRITNTTIEPKYSNATARAAFTPVPMDVPGASTAYSSRFAHARHTQKAQLFRKQELPGVQL
jgi:hypothetical protein